jgi:RNA recognition motif-containing protein
MRIQELEDMFGKYGKFTDAAIAKDRDTGESKGFAFITFLDQRDAKDALEVKKNIDKIILILFSHETISSTGHYIQALDGSVVEGEDKRMKVEFATGGSSRGYSIFLFKHFLFPLHTILLNFQCTFVIF